MSCSRPAISTRPTSTSSRPSSPGAAHCQPGHLLGVTVKAWRLHVGEIAERRRHIAEFRAAALDDRGRLDLEHAEARITVVHLGQDGRGVLDEGGHHRWIEDDAGPLPQREDGRVDPAELTEEGGIHRRPSDTRTNRDVVTLAPFRDPAADPGLVHVIERVLCRGGKPEPPGRVPSHLADTDIGTPPPLHPMGDRERRGPRRGIGRHRLWSSREAAWQPRHPGRPCSCAPRPD